MLREPENASLGGWGPSEEGLAQSQGLPSGKARPGLTPTPPLHEAGRGEPQQDQAWDGRVMTFIASTGEPDRNGNILDIAGWDLQNYRRNPVVLFAHNWNLPPIGKALSIAIEGQLLKATVQFAPTELGQELALLNADGYMRAISVGARPLEWEVRRHPEHGFPIGLHSHRQELIELSIVAIPANPDTVRAGLIDCSAPECPVHHNGPAPYCPEIAGTRRPDLPQEAILSYLENPRTEVFPLEKGNYIFNDGRLPAVVLERLRAINARLRSTP